MSNPKLSEIRLRDQSAPGGARFDVPYLLKLVERLGKLAEKVSRLGTPLLDEAASFLRKEARALLKELEL